MIYAKAERDKVPMWMDAAAAAAGTNPDNWEDSIVTLCAYLEHAYRRSGSKDSRATWLKRTCGYRIKDHT